jgi:hypothetical protein
VTRESELEVPAVPSPAPTLDAFFEHVQYSNPFSVNRVVPSTAVTEDATEIHRAPYTRLTELASQALQRQTAIGALVWGEAGVGKSHLLSRIANWADSNDKQAIFIYLANMQARPEQMPRSLLRCVVSILTRGRSSEFRKTPLYRILNATIRQALNQGSDQSHTWSEAEAAYDRMMVDLCAGVPATAALVDQPTLTVLFRFFRSAYLAHEADDGVAALAVRWLSGDALDLEEARKLCLPPAASDDEAVALADDEQIKRVLVALARFAGFWKRPFILCFDQADNLDREQFAALARFLHALLDGATNLLAVTAGVRATLVGWESEGVFTDSTRDRIAQHQIELQRINAAQARQIVLARLQPLQDHFRSVPQVSDLIDRDPLFPLGELWARTRLADRMDIRPRDVINWAADEWHRQKELLRERGESAWLERWAATGPPEPPPNLDTDAVRKLIDDKIALKVREHVRQRQLDPQNLPPDGDNLAGLIYTLLQASVNKAEFPALIAVERPRRVRYRPLPPFDLTLRQRSTDGGEVRTGLLCLVVSNRKSMSDYLRRLARDAQPPEQIILVTDERRPLDPAAAGLGYLDEVRGRHGGQFRHVNLSFDQYAEVDALQAVIGLARSGDLEVELPGGESRRVGEAEVIESHLRQGRLPAHPLFNQILVEAPVPALPPTALPQVDSCPADDTSAAERDLREFIMGRIGMTMGCSSMELAVQYRDYLNQKQQEPPELDACRARLEETARRMHGDGLLNATPHDDYLYLLNR